MKFAATLRAESLDNADSRLWERRDVKAWNVAPGDWVATPTGIFRCQRIEDLGDHHLKFVFSDNAAEAPPKHTVGPRNVTIFVRKPQQVKPVRVTPRPVTTPNPQPENNMRFVSKFVPLKLWRVSIQRDNQEVDAGIVTARTQGGALAQIPRAFRNQFPVTLHLTTKIPTGRKGCTLLPHIRDLVKL